MFEGFGKPKKKTVGEPERHVPLSGRNLFRNNMPGMDTYDDGADELNQNVRPGSTVTEAGGIYNEDRGPNDLRRRQHAGEEHEFIDPEVTVTDAFPDESDDQEGDEADRWLKENDPDRKAA